MLGKTEATKVILKISSNMPGNARLKACIGYLAHPFEKKAVGACIASLFLFVKWHSAIDRGGK